MNIYPEAYVKYTDNKLMHNIYTWKSLRTIIKSLFSLFYRRAPILFKLLLNCYVAMFPPPPSNQKEVCHFYG